MLLSVYTPFHARKDFQKYLLDAYRSLQAQTHRDWEWCLLPNAKMRGQFPEVPLELLEDPRVRVLPCAVGKELNIGALKRLCCAHARGEAVVELDSDDRLTPDCLAWVAEAFEGGADFVYTDFNYHDLTAEEHSTTFGNAYGWEHYSEEILGVKRDVMRSFEMNPRSLFFIEFSPDHVRCWRKSFYDAIGGHDISLAVCDDHDLLCRTYIAGGRITHVPKCGYLYRIYSGQTCNTRNDLIREHQRLMGYNYFPEMIQEWCRRQQLESLYLTDTRQYADLRREKTTRTSKCRCVHGYIHVAPELLAQLGYEEVRAFALACFDTLAPGGILAFDGFSTSGYSAFGPGRVSQWNIDVIGPVVGTNFHRLRWYDYDHRPQEPASRDHRFHVDYVALKGQRESGHSWPY